MNFSSAWSVDQSYPGGKFREPGQKKNRDRKWQYQRQERFILS
jgi:hypothetical protein